METPGAVEKQPAIGRVFTLHYDGARKPCLSENGCPRRDYRDNYVYKLRKYAKQAWPPQETNRNLTTMIGEDWV